MGYNSNDSVPGTTISLPPYETNIPSKVYYSDNLIGILTSTDDIYFTGYNQYGQFSFINNFPPLVAPYSVLVPVKSSVTNIKKISYGQFFYTNTIYYLTNDNKLYAAGRNLRGVIGNNPQQDTGANGAYLTLTDVSDAVLVGDDGQESGLALLTDKTLRTIGQGYYGQMGNGSQLGPGHNNTSWKTPTKLTDSLPLTNIKEIQGTGFDDRTTFYALDNNGHLYGWGANEYGQLANGQSGNGVLVDRAIRIGTTLTVTDFWSSCGFQDVRLFVKDNTGKIWACGANAKGQLGVAKSPVKNTLTEVTSLGDYNIKEIFVSPGSLGSDVHTFAVTDDDRILSTGYNLEGQCSNGTNSDTEQFALCYTKLNNSSSPIKLKSGISKDNPYIKLGCIGGVGGLSSVLANTNEIYQCGNWGTWKSSTVDGNAISYLTRVKNWIG